jgi:nucleotide-binding universal stress UspA family protein
MYKKILVPLDGSEIGEAALPYVEELLSSFTPEKKVEVILIRVIVDVTHVIIATGAMGQAVSIPYTKAELEPFKKEAMAYLNKVAGSLKKNKGVVVKSMVSIGTHAADEILKASDEIKADLIAISTHGRSGLGRWAFGSVADKVLRGGNTPVLMVRAEKKTKVRAKKTTKKTARKTKKA